MLVWGAVQAGEAANAIPQHGVLRGTLRTADHATWGELEETIRELVASLLAPTGVGYVLEHIRGVPPVVNERGQHPHAAPTRPSPSSARTRPPSTEQSSGGEDFAWYLEHVPGAMARLGVWPGDGPMRDIHQPTFDLDERAIPFGVRVLARSARWPRSPRPDSPGPTRGCPAQVVREGPATQAGDLRLGRLRRAAT